MGVRRPTRKITPENVKINFTLAKTPERKGMSNLKERIKIPQDTFVNEDKIKIPFKVSS